MMKKGTINRQATINNLRKRMDEIVYRDENDEGAHCYSQELFGCIEAMQSTTNSDQEAFDFCYDLCQSRDIVMEEA
jgi:hypothetical protein